MGCDIHVYVEHSSNGKYWRNLTDNAGSRDYLMFSIMAGVRGDEHKLFDPKGLPEGELGWATERAHWLSIAPEKYPEWKDLDGWTSRDNAERWVASGSSKPQYHDGILSRVSHPDWHSHSWLTADELAQCLQKYREVSPPEWGLPTEWVAIHAAMQAIESNGERARVVFWFDN